MFFDAMMVPLVSKMTALYHRRISRAARLALSFRFPFFNINILILFNIIIYCIERREGYIVRICFVDCFDKENKSIVSDFMLGKDKVDDCKKFIFSFEEESSLERRVNDERKGTFVCFKHSKMNVILLSK